ncbi:MAG: FAD-dependent monooxygenase [Planctomycetota bacterium]
MTPLIVGAGPVGKAAALFLARAGIEARIIDATESPSTHSKALAVNPRTLELLRPTGLTEKMLALGIRAGSARLWHGKKLAARVSFDCLDHPFPFMLALSQATTERLLEEALSEVGVRVERGLRLTNCHDRDDHVQAELTSGDTDDAEPVDCKWLLAADGAHSTVRHALGVHFDGSSFTAPWYLADIPLDTSLEEDCAHIFFARGGGFIFAIRVVGDGEEKSSGPLWRILCDRRELVASVPHSKSLGEPLWESSFVPSHRLASRLRVGNIFLAGDAAHVHSPVGARGMNLGIEDAWVFSQLAARRELKRYDDLRRPIDHGVVKRVALVSRVAQGHSPITRLVRDVATRFLIHLPFVQNRVRGTVTGLDHGLPWPVESEENMKGPSNVTRSGSSHPGERGPSPS